MPSIYNFDNSLVPDKNAAYYKNSAVDGVSAFHPSAPKQLPGESAPRVRNDTHKIYMPRNEDHGWGNHTATFKAVSARATPFNNKFKGDLSTHFKMPTGTLGRQSDNTNAKPRTKFAARVKKIIDYLVGVFGNPSIYDSSYPDASARVIPQRAIRPILKQLRHLYANLGNRLPSSQEIETIQKAEQVIANYRPLVVLTAAEAAAAAAAAAVPDPAAAAAVPAAAAAVKPAAAAMAPPMAPPLDPGATTATRVSPPRGPPRTPPMATGVSLLDQLSKRPNLRSSGDRNLPPKPVPANGEPLSLDANVHNALVYVPRRIGF